MNDVAAPTDPAITLYRLQACPYCERVVRVLEKYDLDYHSRFVEAMHAERNVVKRVSGKRTVPAIVDTNTGVTMSESANIVAYLENTYGNDNGDGHNTDQNGPKTMGRDFDVVELEESAHPTVGEQAPDFVRPLVNDEYWEDVALSDLTDEGPVLLVFYPMDGDFPATYIWNELRERAWDEEYDVTIVGLSISSPYEHERFIDERGVQYRLFSDPQNSVAESYGIVNDLDGMAGISEPRPAVFLVNEERTVQYAWVAQEWPEFPEYDVLEEELAAG